MHLRTLALALSLPAGLALAQVSDSTVVIQSGTYTMTKAEFDQLVKSEPALKGRKMTPELRRILGQQYGRAFALEAEAKRQKIDQRPEVKLQIRSVTQQILAAELLEETREEHLEESGKLKAYYEKVKSQYNLPRVRQILIRTKGSSVAPKPGAPERTVEQARALANELRQRIQKGEDFATLAKEYSDDLGSAPKGGDLGLMARGFAAAEFETVAYSIPVGQVSEPVQTVFGIHLLRVEERQPQTFEVLKEALANDLAHQELENVVSKNVKLNEAFFGK